MLRRKDVRRYGDELGIPATPRQAAQMDLLHSRDDEHDAPIWHDNGRTIRRLARTAGVRVEYLHVDLTAQTTVRRVVDADGTQTMREAT